MKIDKIAKTTTATKNIQNRVQVLVSPEPSEIQIFMILLNRERLPD
jgi:hypothetical protein